MKQSGVLPLPGPLSPKFDSSGHFLLVVCKISCFLGKVKNNKNKLDEKIVSAAECFTDEMLASTWRRIE
jgi:hypothetical protein